MSISPRLLLPAATLAAATLTLFGLTACSDDDNPAGGGGGTTPQQQEAIALVNEVVRPVLQTLTLQNYLSLGGIPLQDCTQLGICATGTAESCLGESGQTITFTNCSNNGQIVNGTLTLLGTETEGSGTFNMIIDELIMTGTVGYSVSPSCFTESFSNTTVTLGGKNYSMFGGLEFCQVAAPGVGLDQTAVPTGGFIQFFDASTNTTTNVDFYTEGAPGDFFIYVNQGEMILATCEGNLAGTIECYDPGDFEF